MLITLRIWLELLLAYIENQLSRFWEFTGRSQNLRIHAGAVTSDGKAIILLGDSGAGKSTTALLLTTCGFLLLHDENLSVTPDGRIVASRYPLYMRSTLLPAILTEIQRKTNRVMWHTSQFGSRNRVWVVPDRSLRTVGPAEVHAIVHLQYQPNTPFQFKREHVDLSIKQIWKQKLYPANSRGHANLLHVVSRAQHYSATTGKLSDAYLLADKFKHVLSTTPIVDSQ